MVREGLKKHKKQNKNQEQNNALQEFIKSLT